MTKYLRICLINRSFSQTLTLDYLDSPRVKIYVHDSAKDVFYELSNLKDIRDRSVLKVFEADSSGRGPSGLGPNGLPPVTNADEFLGGVPAAQISGHSRQDIMLPINICAGMAVKNYLNNVYLIKILIYFFAGLFLGILFRHWNKTTALEILEQVLAAYLRLHLAREARPLVRAS